MDDDERAELEAVEHAATHKAAALHNLGPETGAGATIWARAAADELARHKEARERRAAGAPDPEVAVPVAEGDRSQSRTAGCRCARSRWSTLWAGWP